MVGMCSLLFPLSHISLQMSDSDDEAPKGVIPQVDVDLTIVDTDDEAELKNASRRFRTRFQKNSENKRKLKVLYSKLSRDGDDGDDSALPDALFPVAPLIRYQKPFYHCGAKVYAAWTQDAPFRYYCGTIMASKCYGTSNFGDIRRYDVSFFCLSVSFAYHRPFYIIYPLISSLD